MKYLIQVHGFDSGLNEVLSGVHYDTRRKTIVNPVKARNDKCCVEALRWEAPHLRGVKIVPPIVIHYKFFCKNKRRDRMNVASAFDKSFQDALQKVGLIENDGWKEVVGVTFDFAIDAEEPRVAVCIEEVYEEPPEWPGWEKAPQRFV